MQKNANKSLDFGLNMCYNGSVYPERNENHSHLGGIWDVYWITHPANQALFPRFVLFWGKCQAVVLRKSYQMLKSSGYA